MAKHFGVQRGQCPFCCERLELELFEIWGRDFHLGTCCEGMHELAISVLAAGGRESADLLRAMAVDEISGHQVRRTADDGAGKLILDWNLVVCDVKQAVAKRFVNDHHAHCPAPVGWRFGAGIRNGSDLVGVIMVGRPVARAFDHTSVVEVNRLCMRRDVPSALVQNGCSMLYAYAAKEARRRGFAKMITYTMESESGASLQASGWEWDGKAGGGSWSCKSRPREDKSPTEPKNRWVKVLRKTRREPELKPHLAPSVQIHIRLRDDRRASKIGRIGA
jgi:hypothetical protein